MGVGEIFQKCMKIGYDFDQRYINDETEEWSGSQECSTVTRLTLELAHVLFIPMEKALDIVMNEALSFGFNNVEDHMWDVYCRGFLAGQIIGLPTAENLIKVKEAEEIWKNDIEGKYGYYQEVLNEVMEEI